MKKISILILFALSFLDALACDNCNVYLNINPNDYQNTIGLQYRSRYHYGQYNTVGNLMLKHGGAPTYLFANKKIAEYYSRIEINGSYYFNEKWKLQYVIPYLKNIQTVDGLAKYIVNGLGDPILLQNYQLFNTRDIDDSTKFVHRATIGLGVKIPLGSIDRSYEYGTPNIDLQTGTGSWDGLFNFSYFMKVDKVGWSNNINYKINTENKNGFKYGNSLNISSLLFFQIPVKKLVVMPTFGVYGELTKEDYLNQEKEELSGGKSWFVDYGISLYLKKIRISANYQPNFSSVLKDKNQLATVNRFMVGINYNF